MKECKNCSAQFEPKHETRGHEQLYCSVKCRMDAYKKRTMTINQDEARKPETNETNSRTDLQRSEDRINPMGNYIPNVNLEILEGKYQAKTEALEYKLRCEILVKELENANRKINELENELQESDEGEEESGGIMGNIMTMVGNSTILGDAIGGLISNDKVKNFIVSLVPDTTQKQ
jgi:DNA-binding ferritin-like protein (Dps family)